MVLAWYSFSKYVQPFLLHLLAALFAVAQPSKRFWPPGWSKPGFGHGFHLVLQDLVRFCHGCCMVRDSVGSVRGIV